MARTKVTPRKTTGPKGVPRHQLAPRNEGASSSRLDPQSEIERLSAELAQVTRDRALDAIQIGELQGQLGRRTMAHQNCERMLGRMVEERNEAWLREDIARARTDELELYVENIEIYNNDLHEEIHMLHHRLDPHHLPGAAEMDPGVILADEGEPDEEEEDPEELVQIDESDDEGGCVSGMDTDHEG